MSLKDYSNSNELLEINGTVERIIYRNDENGYTVLELNSDKAVITVVGDIAFVNAGEHIKAFGYFKEHRSFGQQFQVQAYERSLPTDEDALIKYLSSGAVKGIGKTTAQKIVKLFGTDTLDVIQNTPEKLCSIKGITKSKAVQISEKLKSIAGIREVIMYFFKFSVSASDSIKIWKKFGAEAIAEVENNPYIICDDEVGVSFDKAEDIARSLSKPINDIERLKYGTIHVIKHNTNNGHTCIPKDKIIPLCAGYLEVEAEELELTVAKLQELGFLQCFELDGREFVALKELYDGERFCADRLKLMLSFPPTPIENPDEKISQIEKSYGIKYARLQREAIVNALQKGLLVMTGGPGTGKTTTIRAIISLLEKNKEKVLLAAPTGRAAKRMSEVTGKEAKTIHRLLCAEFNKQNKCYFAKNEKNLLRCDALILDELSMVDVVLFHALLKALPLNCRLIMIGDSDQLPSVGAGNVLKDIISSEVLPVVRLNEIFRQSMESLIVTNAHKIVCGEYPVLTRKDKDFFFMERPNTDEIFYTVAQLYIERLPKSYGFKPLNDIQILTPNRKGTLGCTKLNDYIQENINPRSAQKAELNVNGYILRDGDKVMQTKNNYDIVWVKDDKTSGEGVFNGDIGTIVHIEKKAKKILVRFDDKLVLYEKESYNDLELAYAITVHKSQGSEFKAVIMPMYFGAKPLYFRNLLYTAVTRAKQILVMVGVPNVVRFMVDNDRKTKRYTALEDFLKE